MTRFFLILFLLLFSASLLWGASSQVELLDAYYRLDEVFPEYTRFWGDMGRREFDLVGDQLHTARTAGSIHIYIINRGSRQVKIDDVLLEGVSLTKAVAFSKQEKEGLNPASIHFAGLSNAEKERLDLSGEPVWWRAEPRTLGPGDTAEIKIRLRKNPESAVVPIKIRQGDEYFKVTVRIRDKRPGIESISFSESLDRVYLYPKHNDPTRKAVKVSVDGINVTSYARIGHDPALNISPVVITLDKPLKKASFHTFQVAYDDGSTTAAGIRIWGDVFTYGIWGAKPGSENDFDLARSYINEIAQHNINLQMEMVGSAAVSSFLNTLEAHKLKADLGIRRMVNAPGKGKEKSPYAYFLRDEPDAADFGVEGVPPLKKIGSHVQSLVKRSEEFRNTDPFTPHLINVDMTFKPHNYYIYGQFPDIFAADPYYQERLRQAYWDMPGRVPDYVKATFVYAVSKVSQSACAPKPLHIILNSVRRTAKDRMFRFATPDEKRIEAFYTLAAGAKGISYWWYTPSAPSYGCGGPEKEAVALWREIGLIGAEVRTAGPVITTGCPASVRVTAPRKLWVRSLVSGTDTLVLLCVNDDYANDRFGTVIHPVEDVRLDVVMPAWMKAVSVFEIDSNGTSSIKWTSTGAKIVIDAGTVNVTRMIVVTSNTPLRENLQKLFDTKFAANVSALQKIVPLQEDVKE